MSDVTATEKDAVPASGYDGLGAAVLAGVAAGIVFGVLIQFFLDRMTAIGALYTLGEPSLSVGWIAHLAHSAIFALVFAVVTWAEPLAGYVREPSTGLLAGAGYGALLWFVNLGFLWPVWLNTVGLMDLSVPYFTVRPLVGHLVWGALFGLLYPVLRG